MTKKIIWTGADLARALLVEVPKNLKTGVVQFNSKDVQPGDLFIALGEGDRDGHKYVADAIERGASAAIVRRDIDFVINFGVKIDQNKLIKVANTLDALRYLADYKRTKSKAKFIAITGSVGKTSTKEAMQMMLSAFGKCFAGRGNFNNYLGVPINLASMEDDIDFAVLELGMNSKGEILALTQQVLPDFAIITSIAENHLEFFDSVEQIAKAKCEILSGLDLNSGVAIIPRDINVYDICARSVDQLGLQRVCIFGKGEGANVRFVSYELMENNERGSGKHSKTGPHKGPHEGQYEGPHEGPLVRLAYQVYNDQIDFVMNVIPEHLAVNFTACFAVAHYLGFDLTESAIALSKVTPGVGRGKVINSTMGGRYFTIISDYYNSSPASLRAALQNMSIFEGDNKVLVIGDMGELGKDAGRLHREMAADVIDSGASRVFLIGDLVKNIAKGLEDSSVECRLYDSTEQFLSDIDKNFVGGEVILIKGSRFMQLEKVAKQLGVQDDL